MTRHEFLKALHELLRPKVYLEIGVQHGWSLQLSQAEITVGIDPNPLPSAFAVTKNWKKGFIAQMTSDEFFDDSSNWSHDIREPIDMAFIDGMHLVENALRDFTNIEKVSHDRTVIVFDDVLPTTQAMASREMCPGDWTGDVWRVYDILRERRPDLVLLLVDTQPTGVLVVMKPDPVIGPKIMEAFEYAWDHGMTRRTYEQMDVLPSVLDRRHALAPSTALAEITRRLV